MDREKPKAIIIDAAECDALALDLDIKFAIGQKLLMFVTFDPSSHEAIMTWTRSVSRDMRKTILTDMLVVLEEQNPDGLPR